MRESISAGYVIDGKYQVDDMLGQGGMGAVYRATHLGTKRTVALKVINPQFSNNTEFIARFRREAEAAGRLRHPNVVDVTDFGFAETSSGQVAYLVMEYLDGCTLADVLSEERVLQIDWVVDVLEQACSAVDYAHRAGIIHRDLKPENIWLEPNRRGGYTVKVLDFGLVKFSLGGSTSASVNDSTDDQRSLYTRPSSASRLARSPDSPSGATSRETGYSSAESETRIQTDGAQLGGPDGLPKSGVPAEPEYGTLIQPTSGQNLESDTLMQSAVSRIVESDTLIRSHNGPNVEQGNTQLQVMDEYEESEESESRTLLQSPALNTQAPLAISTGAGDAQSGKGPLTTKDARVGSIRTGESPQPAVTNKLVPEETADAGGLTRVGAVMGTPLYMSPEQCRGENLDSRSDVYSLAVIAYRMLCGDTPFTGNLDELLRGHTSVEPQSPKSRNRKVPRKVSRVVISALAKDPDRRPSSAAGFASALRAAAEGTGTLLRRSVSLYSEHFPAFLRLSLLAYAPLVAILAANKLLDHFLPMEKAPYLAQVLYGLGTAIFAPMVGHLLAYCIISGVTVPIVVQLNVAPLRPLRIGTGFARLRERWRPFLAASLIVVAVTFFGSLLLLPGIIAAVCFGLYAPVTIMEGRGVWGALKRAFQLSRRSWFTVLVTIVIQFGLPILVLVHFNDVSLKLGGKELGLKISLSDNLTSEASQLLNLFISPLTAIMIALLYLKTRYAGGETLKDAEQALDSEYQPRSKWEERMRTRTLSRASKASDPGSG